MFAIKTQIVTPTSLYIKFANDNEITITKASIQNIVANTSGNSATKRQAVINELLTQLQQASGETVNINNIKLLYDEVQGDVTNFSSGIGL
jgi:hypothetical protein